jgi:hypothetical protein
VTPLASFARAISLAATSCLAAATTPALAQAPSATTATDTRIAAFLPKGYHVIGQASSDFDHDGLADLVVVLADDTIDIESGNEVTCPVLVLLAQRSGGWAVSARAKIDCTTKRGPHGSGFDKVTARRDTFWVRVFENLDSREARFQLRGGRWFLIGAKSTSVTTTRAPGLGADARTCFVQKMEAGETCSGHDVDVNFLTGEMIESSVVDNDREKTVRRKGAVKPLEPMGEWIP